ncbi:kinase-like domain-containing protein [Xylogone sp. PMI_703]|nr:kinase-like domain-containing protein [Xylogone sp. PMI_703]
MTTSFASLYLRNAEDLPAPLPTTSEILASDDIIKGTEGWATRKVVGVGKHFIAKYSRSNDQIESENLLFLERNNFSREADGTLFLVMERLQGDTLDSLWPTLQGSDKDLILSKIRAILTQIRSLPHQGHMPHHLFYWPEYPNDISGPFSSEQACIQSLILKSRLNAQDNKRYSHLADFFEEQLADRLVVDDRMPVFTHSDLQRKNVLVKGLKDGENGKEFHVSLIDWESAGWYPVYWEYFAAFLAFKWNDDWCSKVAKAVDPWPAEAAMMKMIYQDLWL